MVFLVISAGSIVRATGSGMGCPDWPKCFGKLIPPTHIDQVSWKPKIKVRKGEMIIRNETLLVAIQNFTTSDSFNATNWKKYEKHDYAIFNPFHTWVEFINRLATVVLGFPVMLMFLLSFFRKHNKKLNIFLSFLVVALIGFQAWLGKIVVDRNLEGSTITYHMIGIFAIISCLLLLVHINKQKVVNKTASTKSTIWISVFAVIMTLVMVVLGTQVREEIDIIAKQILDRSQWIENLSYMFILHRSTSWIILIVNALLLYKLRKAMDYRFQLIMISILLLSELILGIVLAYANVPAVGQPLHLILASLLFAFQMYLFIQLRGNYLNSSI